jgi:hypothetical protein
MLDAVRPDHEDVAEIELRQRIAQALGSAHDRRAARERLGLSQTDVAELTGLPQRSVARREAVAADGSDVWRFKRGSLASEAGYRYVLFIAKARGIELA